MPEANLETWKMYEIAHDNERYQVPVPTIQEDLAPGGQSNGLRPSSHISKWIVTDRGKSLSAAHPPGTQERASTSESGIPLPRTLDELRECLNKAKPRNKEDKVLKNWYFPRGVLEQIIVEETVIAVLSELKRSSSKPFDEDIQSYARKICQAPGHSNEVGPIKSYRKIFTILVLVESSHKILDFIKHELSDEDLPLKRLPMDKEESTFGLRRDSNHDEPLHQDCFNPRMEMFSENFYKYQWTTLATYFAKGQNKKVWLYPLLEEDILPWTEEERRIGSGGFSEVYQVHIHPSHHNFDDPKASSKSFPSPATPISEAMLTIC